MAKSVKILSTETLSSYFFQLKKVKYEVENSKGVLEEINREVYFSLNGVTALLYNRQRRSVILTQQFRLPSYLNQNPSGMMIEACAGLVEEGEDPEVGMIREIEEETGYKIENVEKLFELYSTAGSVTEKLYYFVAEYDDNMKTSSGGGLAEESEDIEVIELSFEDACFKVESGEIKDAKTVILLQYAKINIFGEDVEEKVFDIL